MQYIKNKVGGNIKGTRRGRKGKFSFGDGTMSRKGKKGRGGGGEEDEAEGGRI